jgi:predicted DCC family thiol-disulfide oxidoreductase YuxK
MPTTAHASHSTPFEVFYDGACILCRKEMDMLKRWDRDQVIVFTDIADPDFAKSNNTTKSYDELMAEIHGRVLGEPIIKGVEVFRQLYGRLGWKMAVSLSRFWGIRHLMDLAYIIFAKNRLRLTGRCKDDVCQID